MFSRRVEIPFAYVLSPLELAWVDLLLSALSSHSRSFCEILNEAARYNGPPGTHSTVSFNSLSFSSPSFSLQKLHLLPNYFRCPITSHSLSSDAINPESPPVYAEGSGCSARGRREKARRWEERKRGGRRTRNWRILFHGRLQF